MQSLEENQFNVDLTCDQITSVLLTTQQSIDIEQIQTDQSANGAAENKTLIETEEKFTRPLAMPKGKQKTKVNPCLSVCFLSIDDFGVMITLAFDQTGQKGIETKRKSSTV